MAGRPTTGTIIYGRRSRPCIAWDGCTHGRARKAGLLLRGDLQRAYREIAECRIIIQEKDEEIAALKNDNIRLTGEVNALNEAMRRLASGGGDGRLLRRYENLLVMALSESTPRSPRDQDTLRLTGRGPG